MVRLLMLLATLPVLAACAGGSTKPASEIAFTVNGDGWGSIWLMHPDGGDRRRLTAASPPRARAVGARTPAWSPDGTRIAYAYGTSDERNASDIYVMRADGGDMRRDRRVERGRDNPNVEVPAIERFAAWVERAQPRAVEPR